MPLKNSFALFLAMVLSSVASASTLNSEMSRFSNEKSANLAAKGVGYGCLTMTTIEDGLPCSAALMGLPRASRFTAQIFLGNGYQAARQAEQLLSGNVTQDFVKGLFAENQILEAEANAELVFQTRHFGISFAPYRLNYFSRVRNAVYPVIDVLAFLERNFTVQTGFGVGHGIYLGLQGRLVNRRFIQTSFSVFDLATDTQNKILQPKTQNGFLLEPSIAYFAGGAWSPRISAAVTNMGFYDENHPEFANVPIPQVGVGVQPPLQYGVLELGIDYREDARLDGISEKLLPGASFRMGAMQLVASINARNMNGGVLFSMSPMRVGIVYNSTRLPGSASDAAYAQTVYTQFGFEM
jgi:hypothetical protein